MKTYKLKLNELDSLVEDVLKSFKSGVIVLKGDLAAGKTTLVKAMAKALGVTDEVTSPTFSLQNCYGNGVYHYDIYNHGLERFVSLGMLEELDKDGLHFVEWGTDELMDVLSSAGIETMSIEIDKITQNVREYKVCIR